ncbi:Omp28-related outer membrane protein [Chryseobacterium sp. Tr-659]|uniref:choice-of-anchor J domain-containing protein n=1 Tax=Chryseobacterium sp. Tr-659 TaxID=2608340 RepID=UPI00141D92A7|nr:Omp28-related outer membrane protein [Chryseobacterium sp. Tr-659]NIF07809.1 Omp28-related outer membrane protein [Chryseobacterium sp. Tr-659]
MKKILFMACILIFGIHQSQTYYSQDFNTTGLNGWVSTDLDGDGQQWANLNASSIDPNLGSGSLVSFSYQNNQALTPNNLITSPLIDLSTVTASNVYLIYDQATNPNYPAEKYSVYVTSSNVPATITASTPVYTETVASGAVQNKSINLSPYIGQQVYVSFRHYDCTDNFYLIIDNVKVKTVGDNDITVKKIALDRYGLANANYTIKATVKNNGAQSVNNMAVNWTDGTGDHLSTIPLASPLGTGQEITVSHPIAVNFASVADRNINFTITQVNGLSDSSPADNAMATKFATVSQNSPKKVVIEEGTGTWCGYCPRGAIAMQNATNNFPNDFIGIAVHGGSNSEPMKVTEYADAANFPGFPTLNVDRTLLGEDVSTDFSPVVNARKTLIVPAALSATSTLAGQTLTLNASAVFRSNFTNASYRFAVVMIENGVTGTTAAYNQVNYYAGNAMGPMGGYENKPNPVPAADMVYDHVGRMLLGGYAGQVGSIPAVITDGQTVNYTFTADIPANYNLNKMKAVLLLIDSATGEIANAAGPFAITGSLGVKTNEAENREITIYPNPAKDYIKVQAKGKVDLKILDANGRIVLEKAGVEPDTSVSTQSLIKGVYLISLKEKGSEPITKKLIIK